MGLLGDKMTTYTMKIGTNSQSYANAEFSFGDNSQNNPRLVAMNTSSQRQMSEMPYSQIHFYIDTDGTRPKVIQFSGIFTGTNRVTAYRNLSKIMHSTGLKRFWLNSDYFMLGTGALTTQRLTSKQPLFIPYSGTFVCISPFIYGATLRTKTQTVTSDNSWANTSSGLQNQGNAPAHIWEIHVKNNSAVDITSVEISDASSGGGNIVKWTGTLASGDTLVLYLLYEVTDNVPYTVEKQYYLNDGSHNGTRNFIGKNNLDWVRIEPSATQTFSARINFNGSVGSGAEITYKWYDSWWE